MRSILFALFVTIFCLVLFTKAAALPTNRPNDINYEPTESQLTKTTALPTNRLDDKNFEPTDSQLNAEYGKLQSLFFCSINIIIS